MNITVHGGHAFTDEKTNRRLCICASESLGNSTKFITPKRVASVPGRFIWPLPFGGGPKRIYSAGG